MLFRTKWHLKVIIAELSRARCGAPWVGKFGYLCIREFLSASQAYQCKITQSTGMPTQMKLDIFFAGTLHGQPRLMKQRQLKSQQRSHGKRKLFLYQCCLKY